MNASAIYHNLRFANMLHKANAARCQSLLQRTADAYEQSRDPLPPRFSKVMKLAAYSGVANVGATLGVPGADVFAMSIGGGLLADTCLPRSWVPPKLMPLRALPYTSAAIGTTFVADLLVGCGANVFELDSALPVEAKDVSPVIRYGLLGLLEKALTDKAETLAANNKHASANACYIAATIYAFPLELVRVSLLAATVLAQLPLSILWVTAKVAYCAAKFAINRHDDPAFYVPGLHSIAPVLVNQRGYRATFTDRASEQMAVTSAVHSAHTVARKLNDLTPIFRAANANKMEVWLEDYVRENKVTCWRAELTELESEIEKLRDKKLDEKTFFTSLGKFDAFPVWQQATFRSVALRLHPDKKTSFSRALSADAQQAAERIYAIVTELAERYKNKRWSEPTPSENASIASHASRGRMVLAN